MKFIVTEIGRYERTAVIEAEDEDDAVDAAVDEGAFGRFEVDPQNYVVAPYDEVT